MTEIVQGADMSQKIDDRIGSWPRVFQELIAMTDD
jgi:hypothetical protein